MGILARCPTHGVFDLGMIADGITFMQGSSTFCPVCNAKIPILDGTYDRTGATVWDRLQGPDGPVVIQEIRWIFDAVKAGSLTPDAASEKLRAVAPELEPTWLALLKNLDPISAIIAILGLIVAIYGEIGPTPELDKQVALAERQLAVSTRQLDVEAEMLEELRRQRHRADAAAVETRNRQMRIQVGPAQTLAIMPSGNRLKRRADAATKRKKTPRHPR